MRIYTNFPEALGEIKRDLAEMGIRIHPKTYQDKYIADKPEFETLELQNYIYTVTNPNPDELKPDMPWAMAEWGERLHGISGKYCNPGCAWQLRREVWEPFLHEGAFSYTYSERLAVKLQVQRVIKHLKRDPGSRQLYISIWNPEKDIENIGGVARVPCSLGYYVQRRGDKLNLTYLQRSADFITHFVNDVYLAVMLQKFIAHSTEIPVGTFTHWIGSLHMFRKDAEGVF